MAQDQTQGRDNFQSPPIPEDELETFLDEIAEVKHFLFCCLLLSHSTLLPIALQSGSIEEFLANGQVTQANLRDLTLKLERPLQDVRDACVDLIRGENDDEPEDDANRTYQDDGHQNFKRKTLRTYRFEASQYQTIPEKYQTTRKGRQEEKTPIK